jgi:hypothetical protein
MPTVFPYYIAKKYSIRAGMRRFWISCGANGTHCDTSIEDPMDVAVDRALKMKI